MTNFDKQPEKVYFTAKEAAHIVDESTSCLRYWAEQLGMDINRGVRYRIKYTVKQVNELTMIKRLVRTERYTLEGAIKAMKELEKKSKEIDLEEKEIFNQVTPPTKSYHYHK